MESKKRKELKLGEEQGFQPEAGHWVWALQDTRKKTLEVLAQIDQEALDWVPPYKGNSIGTLLYHITAIEADYLYGDLLGRGEFPEEIDSLLPLDIRDGQGQLSLMAGETLEEHLHRLEVIREALLKYLKNMPAEEFRRLRELPEYRVTPEWVLYHLMQHEAEHRGQIQEIYLNYRRQK